MEQKMVIKVSMHSDKAWSKFMKITACVCGIMPSMSRERTCAKAMRIAVTVHGVKSVALEGDDKDKIVVIGSGVDSVCLTTMLRKKVGYSELVSVEPVEKKVEEKKPTTTVETVAWCPASVAHYPIYEPCQGPCAIM